MTNKLIAVLTVLSIALVSCTKTESRDVTDANPQNEAKTNASDQNYWIGRINAYISASQSPRVTNLLTLLKGEVASDYSTRNTNIQNLGFALSGTLSREDFTDLFVNKGVAPPASITETQGGCQICVDYLRDWAQVSDGGDDDYVVGWPDCNCSWTCGDSPLSACNTSDCNSSGLGCGFLWLQSCDGYDSLYPC